MSNLNLTSENSLKKAPTDHSMSPWPEKTKMEELSYDSFRMAVTVKLPIFKDLGSFCNDNCRNVSRKASFSKSSPSFHGRGLSLRLSEFVIQVSAWKLWSLITCQPNIAIIPKAWSCSLKSGLPFKVPKLKHNGVFLCGIWQSNYTK